MAEPRIEVHMTGGGDVNMDRDDAGDASPDVMEAGEMLQLPKRRR